MTNVNPYNDLPENAFWRTGVVNTSPDHLDRIYTKKWNISPDDLIASAGSCFAQHITRNLKTRNFRFLDVEMAPPGLPDAIKTKFGFDMYSARYGNIYTSRQLLQLALEAMGKFVPGERVWKKGDRYYDALRPAVEPNGLSSEEMVLIHRQLHLQRVLKMLRTMDILVFTLGLTETWVHRSSQTAYPVAPGVIAGTYSPDHYEFKNLGFDEILADLIQFDELMSQLRVGMPKLRYILTVSPVPLTATGSGRHVLSATIYSKAVLRAVAGALANEFEFIDYFPSFEIITNPAARSGFYDDNLRTIRREAVDYVMNVFFNQHASSSLPNKAEPAAARPVQIIDRQLKEEEIQCEEAMIESLKQ